LRGESMKHSHSSNNKQTERDKIGRVVPPAV
jgi:hypothetical protein